MIIREQLYINKLDNLDEMENSLVVPPKVAYNITNDTANSTPSYIPPNTENRCSNKYLYIDVHSSTSHNS